MGSYAQKLNRKDKYYAFFKYGLSDNKVVALEVVWGPPIISTPVSQQGMQKRDDHIKPDKLKIFCHVEFYGFEL